MWHCARALRFALLVGVASVGSLDGCSCTEPVVPAGDGGHDGGVHFDGGAIDGAAGDGQAGRDALGTDLTGRDQQPGQDTSAYIDAGGCPAYQAACDGGCIATSVDPLNCGGCGVQCTGVQVCSASGCSETCLTGLTPCDNHCVDVLTDNNHCGTCIGSCDAGMGCVEGTCRTAVPLGTPTFCDNGGAPIVDPGLPTAFDCTGNLAQVTFRWALCTCQGIQFSDDLLTDGYDSRRGPYEPGGLGGGVGLNGAFTTSAPVAIYGSLWGSASAGLSTSNQLLVRQELHLGGRFQSASTAAIGSHAWVDGDVTANQMAIGGTLYVPSDANVGNGVSAAAIVRGPVAVPPPCDCQPSQLIPIAAIVASRASANDNAAIGLDADVLRNPTAPVRLDLPCGRYYLSQITGSRDVAIVAHGRTALYVGGNVSVSAPLHITLDPTAELDVFVGGSFSSSTPYVIGSPNYPSLARFYIAGDFGISQGSVIGGYFYALGQVHASAPIEVFGGIFADRFANSAETAIHYDRAVLQAGQSCPPPGHHGVDAGVGDAARDAAASDVAGADRAVVDAGRPDSAQPPQCTTCQECGNQACVSGSCGACTDSAQCCPPLVCMQGVCVPYAN